MSVRRIIETAQAPAAIGTYSQAVQVGEMLYVSGQIPLVANTMTVVSGDIRQEIAQVFENISVICQAAGGEISDVVKLTIYLCDLGHFPIVNEVMSQYFNAPYPARAVIEVSRLPKDVAVEMDAIVFLKS